MVSSAPVMLRLWPFMARSCPRKSVTSEEESMASLRSMGRASKARWLMGSDRMLMVGMVATPLFSMVLDFVSSAAGGLGAFRSSSSSSASRDAMSPRRDSLAVSWADLSASNASISALTAASCWALPGSTSLMAVSSSASRV